MSINNQSIKVERVSL